MYWDDLLAALALYLVLEGLIPFFSPAGFRRFVQSMSDLSDSAFRGIGLSSMIGGLLMLYLVRH